MSARRLLIAAAQLLLSPRFHLLVAVVAVLVALSGCATPYPAPVRDRVLVQIELTEDLPPDVWGRAWCVDDGGWCQMQLRRSTYPYCFAHEGVHLFSDAWHSHNPSERFCMMPKP